MTQLRWRRVQLWPHRRSGPCSSGHAAIRKGVAGESLTGLGHGIRFQLNRFSQPVSTRRETLVTWKRWSTSAGVAMLALLAIFVAACGGGSQTTTTTLNRSGTITIWHGYEGTYLESKKSIYDAYMKQYPNVTINLVHKPNLTDAVTAAAGAGQGPDIVAWVDDQIGKWVKLEAIKPMDSYVNKDYMTSQYTQAAVDAATFEGKIYGMPEAVEAITIIYNKKLI